MPYRFLRKLLSLFVIVALVSLRLSTFTEQAFIEPVEDALFDVAFIASDETPEEGKLLKAKPKRAFDIVLATSQDIVPVVAGLPALPVPFVAELSLDDILAEIFIPPEAIS